MRTATLVRDNLPWCRGHGALYYLNPPMRSQWLSADFEFVIVSSSDAIDGEMETCIFPSDGGGSVVSQADMDGHYEGADHVGALRHAGYEVSATDAVLLS